MFYKLSREILKQKKKFDLTPCNFMRSAIFVTF